MPVGAMAYEVCRSCIVDAARYCHTCLLAHFLGQMQKALHRLLVSIDADIAIIGLLAA